jgi:glycosyltransferase involved in cell wall biosynthesis
MNTVTPTFSLAYTSVRPAILPQIVKLWDERSKNKDHEWCLSVDEGHEPARASAVAVAEQYAGKHPIKVAINKGRKNCVDGWNAAAAATTGKVIIAVADDFVPPPNWDESLLALKPEGWQDGEHVVHVNDGFIGHIFTLAILTRKRYDRFGYLWYPGYESMFVDTEFGEVAKRDGVVIEAMQLLFEHMHHACGKRPKDSADANHENDVRWKRGEMLFNYRKQRDFPVDLGPKVTTPAEVPTLTESPTVGCIMVGIPPDDLLARCERMIESGVKTFYFAVVNEMPDGRKISSEDVVKIAHVSDRLKLLQDTKVNTKIYKVPMYRYPAEPPEQCFTRLRADIMSWINADDNSGVLSINCTEPTA